MAQYGFGSGVLLATRNDVALATPIDFGALQDISLDFSFNTKELYGQNQFPLAVARGTGKITGKAKTGKISGRLFADLFFGETVSTGQAATAYHEAASIPATPYQVTVANGATFVTDQGVVSAVTGIPLAKVATAPTTGQYSVGAGGVYTFAAADTLLGVLISYTYTVAATGQSFTINNHLLGTTPTFQVQLYAPFQGKQLNILLYKCASSKLSIPTKLEDYVIPELDFSAFANDAGVIGMGSFSEAS